MFDSETTTTTPPSLTHSPTPSDRGRESTVESTPLGTPPISIASPKLGHPRKDRDLYFAWHRKAPDAHHGRTGENTFLESDLLFTDSGDESFALFPDSPPSSQQQQHRQRPSLQSRTSKHSSSSSGSRIDRGTANKSVMGPTATPPLDISTPPRFNSTSPRNQTSTLTSQLQEANAKGVPPVAVGIESSGDNNRLNLLRPDQFSNGLSSTNAGARPISVRDRPRRESTNMGSLTNGMSWGGVSVGSWIRDDIMTGTSPYMFAQSPSFHSSSYLPRMEAQYLRDYTCCGVDLENMHTLLEHFETHHSQASDQITSRPSQTRLTTVPTSSGVGSSNGLSVTSHGFGDSQGAQVQAGFQPSQQRTFGSSGHPRQNEGFRSTPLSTVQDVDTLEDMEMDEPDDMSSGPSTQQMPYQPQPQQPRFGTQPNQQVPQLNIGLANNMQAHQGLRTSTPTTPMAGHTGFPFHNPTVSSVNTPALSSHTMQQPQKTSPDSSHPGTPGEFDPSTGMGGLPMSDLDMMQAGGAGWNGLDFMRNGMMDLTIDEPAKRLLGRQTGYTAAQLQYAMKQGQLAGDGDLIKQIQAAQLRLGPGGFVEQEIKPFKCPVIGCEKAYKNQNGLKYHKQHGHQNQQLKDNGDGTFSIVDPTTSIPYPGDLGMAKEKPYNCEVCGKRYKNLNGLKYHRQHSLPCNPNLKLPDIPLPNVTGLQGMNVNVAGAGLVGPMDQLY